jgi:hypothetical protein
VKESQDSTWEDILKPQKPAPQASELGDGAPEDEDLGSCASQPMPKGWTGIHILGATEGVRGFQYMHLGYENFALDGRSFVVEFNINIAEKWRVTVRRRRLWRIYVNLHHHKLEWIRKADRDFDDGRPIITAIAIEQVTEAEAQPGRQRLTRPALVAG